MHKKLTTSAATSLLLLGASGAAMAQEPFPPLVVASVQATADVAVDSIAAGSPCVDAIQTLRAVPMELQGTNVIGTFLTFVMGTGRSGSNAILICTPELPAIAVPPPPPPP
jgi:hypothetical protein